MAFRRPHLDTDEPLGWGTGCRVHGIKILCIYIYVQNYIYITIYTYNIYV